MNMSYSIDSIDISKLSLEVRTKLAEIDLEYSDGNTEVYLLIYLMILLVFTDYSC